MANNLIYPFGQNASGGNILTDANYQSDNQRLIGNQPGIARQELVNKALRSDSVIAAAVSQFIADNQNSDVHDSLSLGTLVNMFKSALDSAGLNASTLQNNPVFHGALQTSQDLNTITQSGFYQIASGTSPITNGPSGVSSGNFSTGQLFVFHAGTATAGQILLDQGSNYFYFRSGNPTYSGGTWKSWFDIKNGSSLVPYNVGNAAQNSEAVNLGQFPATQGTSGYQKFPSGLIIQWISSGGADNALYSFPIAFPNNIFNVFVTDVNSGDTVSNAQVVGINTVSLTGTRIAVVSSGGTTYTGTNNGVHILAIGN